jgi:hypothetical protein
VSFLSAPCSPLMCPTAYSTLSYCCSVWLLILRRDSYSSTVWRFPVYATLVLLGASHLVKLTSHYSCTHSRTRRLKRDRLNTRGLRHSAHWSRHVILFNSTTLIVDFVHAHQQNDNSIVIRFLHSTEIIPLS